MGFYPSDTLLHEAQRTGVGVRAPDVNASQVACHVEDDLAIRVGLGYLMGARADEVAAIVAEREANGPYVSLEDLASRAGAGRPALEVLAWSGACDGLIGASTAHARRTALWKLGITAPAHTAKTTGDTQLALPLELPEAPKLAPLEAWERMVADYASTGVTLGPHPMELIRPELGRAASSRDLETLRHGADVRIGGLVVARQRPATANGIVFMLLEDGFGTINLIVPPPTYERDRLVVRGEPLVFAEGRLEKHLKAAGAHGSTGGASAWPSGAPGSETNRGMTSAAGPIRLVSSGRRASITTLIAPAAWGCFSSRPSANTSGSPRTTRRSRS